MSVYFDKENRIRYAQKQFAEFDTFKFERETIKEIEKISAKVFDDIGERL